MNLLLGTLVTHIIGELKVIIIPLAGNIRCILNTGTQHTWRAAAYHAQEAYSSRGDKWWVNGYHFFYPNGKEILDVMTSVGDCSIYDGWWD